MRTGKVLAVLLVALTGCDRTDGSVYRCQNPDKGHKDATGAPDPCHRNDLDAGDTGDAGDAGLPNDAGETCAGECLPIPPNLWAGPELVWMGDEVDAPPCPAIAPLEGFAARRPPAEVQPCATTCSCMPPSGSCALPATVTAAATSCAGDSPGVAHTSSDPPASWGGLCDGENAISAGQLCGGVPCVQSITVAPLIIKENDCQLVEKPSVPPPPWGTFARACIGTDPLLRCTMLDACVPAAPSPEFKQCVATISDHGIRPCPSSYPEKSVFYEEFVDKRTCTPCMCDAPKDSACTGSIGLFSDATCGAPLVGSTVLIDAEGPKCYDVPKGSALGSKSASEPKYRPGTCPVVGGQQGEIEANVTWVVCCQGTP